MLKIRLKQSVIERKARNGPAALRRHERLLDAHRRQQKQQNSLSGTSKYIRFDARRIQAITSKSLVFIKKNYIESKKKI